MEPWQFTQNALFVLFSSEILENTQFQMYFSCLKLFSFFMWISPYETLRVKKCRKMCECEFECVSPDIDWEPVQSLLHLLPNGSWNTLQPPCDPEFDGWTDGHGRVFCSLKWMLFNCSSFKDFTESAKWSWSGKLFLSLDAADWRALSILLFRLEWRTTKRFWVF